MKRREVLGLVGAACVASAIGRRVTAAPPAAPQVRRLVRSLAGETVNIKDYCAADGRQIDTQTYQELIDLQPGTIIYPPNTRLQLDAPIELRGDQTHNFASGARIDAETKDFALFGFGRTGQHLADLAQPIERYARQFVVDRSPEVAAGDMILLVDVSDTTNFKIDINVVEQVDGHVVVTRYPIGRSFADPAGFQWYHVYDPLRNLRFAGNLALVNHHPKGGGLRLTNTVDANLSGVIVEDAGYIGISVESSIRAQLRDMAVRGSGASGLGFRAAKHIVIDGFTARNVRADESLTFYDNVSHVDAKNIAIEQHLYQEKPRGYSAGNNILVDMLCSRIALSNVSCTGSATYNVMFHNQCDDCSLTDFVLRRSNLGGIRVSDRSDNTRIARGVISDVTDALDQEGRKPVSAISIGSACNGTTIGADVTYERIATGLRVGTLRDR